MQSSIARMPLELYPFRYRDTPTGKWVRARYVAELHEIAARYKEWEITGAPEIRQGGDARHFNPLRSEPAVLKPALAGNVEHAPEITDGERWLVLLFLRRYVTYCARRGRFAQAGAAAMLWRELLTIVAPHSRRALAFISLRDRCLGVVRFGGGPAGLSYWSGP